MLLRLVLIRLEAPLRIEIECPPLAHEPLVQAHALAGDPANAEPRLGVVGIRPVILAGNASVADQRDERVTCFRPARPLSAALVDANLVALRGIDALQLKQRSAQPDRIAILDD